MTFALINEDLRNLGGPMGTESTSIRWTRYFSSLKAAKKAAEVDYGQTIGWTSRGRYVSSGDLLHTMYTIEKLEIE